MHVVRKFSGTLLKVLDLAAHGFNGLLNLRGVASLPFVAVLRDDGESDLTPLDIKHRITRCTLSVNGLFLCNQDNFPALADSGKEP